MLMGASFIAIFRRFQLLLLDMPTYLVLMHPDNVNVFLDQGARFLIGVRLTPFLKG